ncbi:hypothetical protein Peur_037520 [Populus x canadensis]
MENSMSCKPVISSSSNEKTTDHDSFEESGWTMYFEDFFAQNNEEDHNHDRYEHGSFSYDHDRSPSLVSDAASLVVKKSAGDHLGEQVVGLPINNNRSFKYSLSFKKKRTKGALVDDALEDTASSPVNSPKVYDDMMINQYKRNTKQKDNKEISQDEGSASRQVDKRSDFGFIGGGSDNTALKKRGLCLVPLSMVVNYLG